MPARPELIRPDDAATAAAMGRAMNALTALLVALGEGSHQFNIVAERTNDTIVTADLTLSVGASPLRVKHTEEGYLRFFALLTFALEYSTIRRAVLVATTADEPFPRACGWNVRDGWLHPMDRRELQEAVIPHPDVIAPLRLVHDAPELPHIPDTDEESPRG
ncbi:hypothetical protein ACIPSA_50905 [Streptomyces sp. NPDC086549]|uniref:hypothetical protein n=1 Tax=Streptomyces sp. NPDC086549 TaxID=3365752 RepID=UPI0038031BD2